MRLVPEGCSQSKDEGDGGRAKLVFANLVGLDVMAHQESFVLTAPCDPCMLGVPSLVLLSAPKV